MIALDEMLEEKKAKEKKLYFIVQLCFADFFDFFFHRSNTTKT